MAYTKLPYRNKFEVSPINKNERWSGVVERWRVTRDGIVVARFKLKKTAVRFARVLAKGRWVLQGLHGTLKIKGRDGTIQDERTYGNDPRNTKG